MRGTAHAALVGELHRVLQVSESIEELLRQDVKKEIVGQLAQAQKTQQSPIGTNDTRNVRIG